MGLFRFCVICADMYIGVFCFTFVVLSTLFSAYWTSANSLVSHLLELVTDLKRNWMCLVWVAIDCFPYLKSFLTRVFNVGIKYRCRSTSTPVTSTPTYLVFGVSSNWRKDELQRVLVNHSGNVKDLHLWPKLEIAEAKFDADEDVLQAIERDSDAKAKPIRIIRVEYNTGKLCIHWRNVLKRNIQSVRNELVNAGFTGCQINNSRLEIPDSKLLLQMGAVCDTLRCCLNPQPNSNPTGQVKYTSDRSSTPGFVQVGLADKHKQNNKPYSSQVVVSQPKPFQHHHQQQQQQPDQIPIQPLTLKTPGRQSNNSYSAEIVVEEPMWDYLNKTEAAWLHGLRAKLKSVWRLDSNDARRHYVQVLGKQDDVEETIEKLAVKIQQKSQTNIIGEPRRSDRGSQKRQLVSGEPPLQRNPLHSGDQTAREDKPSVFSQRFLSGRLQIEVVQRNLVNERVMAIVNPANVKLNHGGGAAKAIADAAGRELTEECDHILKFRPGNRLQISEPVHTTAGRLRPDVRFVIHVAGPRIDQYNGDTGKVYQKAQDAFYNSMRYANDNIHAKSLAIPAIGSGIFGLDKKRVAHEAFTALEKFTDYISRSPQVDQHLTLIRFTNFDEETTGIFGRIFQERFNRSSDTVRGRARSRSTDYSRANGTQDLNGGLSKSSSPRHRSKYVGHDIDINSPGVSGRRGRSDKNVNTNSGGYDNLSDDNDKDSNDISGEKKRLLRNNGMSDIRTSLTDLLKQTSQGVSDWFPHPLSKNSPKKARLDGRGAGDGGSKAETNRNSKTPNRSLVNELSSGMGGASANVAGGMGGATAKADDCVICMCEITDPKRLDCGHTFCKDCIEESFKKCQPKCPSCGRMFGALKGNQPYGTMSVRNDPTMKLSGHGQFGVIVITYDFPDGIQGPEHPNPGEPYRGTRRTAFLPDSPEGQRVCDLLKKGFNRSVIFTIGRSVTTGRDNVVIWNDIHHKTSPSGQYGYPDPTYLDRVRDELAAKGVTDDDGGGSFGRRGNRETDF